MRFFQKWSCRRKAKKERRQKDLMSLDFASDFMFSVIIQDDEEVCKRLIWTLLRKKIVSLAYHSAQKTFKHFYRSKGVRFDAFIEGDGEIYEIEIQTTNARDLTKRVRYYRKH